MTLIDTHCHLDHSYSPKVEADLVREAHALGVEDLITIGTKMENVDVVRVISERYPKVWHTVGVHPHYADELVPSKLECLRAASHHPKCVALGEMGLDYYYNHSSRENQRAALKLQLDLALECKLPVIIHARDAEADLLPLLTEYAHTLHQTRPQAIPGVIHCFTGTQEFGQNCLALGFYISFSGILTFPSSDALRESARIFPLERLLVETDSPYLAPVPHRGRKCEPQLVRFTAMKLAETKGLSLDAVAEQTTANAHRVFAKAFGQSAGS